MSLVTRLVVAAALICLSSAAPAQGFDPLAFFTGKTRGAGSLKVLMKTPVPIQVESKGWADGKGGIILEQTIHEGEKPPRKNRWELRPTSPTTLAGTASNTPGPVRGKLRGNRLQLNYAMKGGMRAEQVLTMQPGGLIVISRMIIRKLGIKVAQVEEVITKVD